MDVGNDITTALLDTGWAQAARGWIYRRSPVLALAVGLVVVLALTGLLLSWPRAAPVTARAAPGAPPAIAPRSPVLVYVSGAVADPGIYRLDPSLRVRDAIELAGGITPEADSRRMPNLAAHVRDGREIRVPLARPDRGPASGGRQKGARVNLNTATAAELERVPGMDPSLAEAIVAHREAFGPFLRLSELKSQLGVDDHLFRELRRYLAVE